MWKQRTRGAKVPGPGQAGIPADDQGQQEQAELKLVMGSITEAHQGAEVFGAGKSVVAAVDRGQLHILAFQPVENLLGHEPGHNVVLGALEDAHRAPHLCHNHPSTRSETRLACWLTSVGTISLKRCQLKDSTAVSNGSLHLQLKHQVHPNHELRFGEMSEVAYRNRA